MEKTYINNARPKHVQLRTHDDDTVLIIAFEPFDGWDGEYDPNVWLRLKPEKNEMNVKMVRALGCDCPSELTPTAALNLQIVAGPTLVLVDGKPRYINEGRALKVFDNRGGSKPTQRNRSPAVADDIPF